MKKIILLTGLFLIAITSRAQVTLPGTWLAYGGTANFTSISTDLDFGDGISDGALRVAQTVAGGGQGATYTFGGTMVNGETYTIITNVGNFGNSFIKFKVSLYDLTSATELATTAEITVNNSTTLTGAGINIAYTATSLTAGHQLQLRYIRSLDVIETSKSFYIDNAKLNGLLINPAVITNTWNGTVWSTGAAPLNSATNSANAVVISGNYSEPISFQASSLTITNNAIATLPALRSMNLFGPITVEPGSSFTISNNSNLLQTNVTNSGNITVKRESNALLRLDYSMWSSPVSGAQTLADFSPLTSQSPNRFYTYDSSSDLYTNVAPTSTFAKGIGYLIRMSNDASSVTPTAYPGVFTGVPNTGTVTLGSVTPLVAGKFYSVGNPYPSSISASSFIAGTTGLGTTLYFWRKTNGVDNTLTGSSTGTAYATWTSLGGTASGNVAPNNLIPNGQIAVGQGFIVNTGTATTINFTNAMRTTTAATFLKSKAVATPDRVWLNLTNATGAFSQALVGYTADATLGLDMYDGKYINDSPVALTSNINNEEFTIQGRPAFDASDVVTLNFKTNVAGDYTIALDQFDGVFATGQDVYLLDSKTGAETDLKAGSYTFTATAGVDNARFSLKYQKTLKVDALAINENSVSVYKNNGTLYVNSGSVAINTIEVYDVQGRLLASQKNVKATTATINNLRAINQVLIVKVSSDDNSVVSKKVMN